MDLPYKEPKIITQKKKNASESNSLSQLSTTSDGEHNIINHQILNKNKEKKKEDDTLEDSIKKGLREISDKYNSNLYTNTQFSLASLYYCNLDLDENDLNNLKNKFEILKKEKKKKIGGN